MRILGGRALAVAVIAAVVLGAVSCGDDGESDRVAAVVGELQRAFVERDLDRLCEGMTFAAQKQAGSVAHGVPTTCPRNVHRLIRVVHESGGDPSRAPEVEGVELEGSRAVATAVLDGGTEIDIPLAESRAGWRLETVAGLPRSRIARIEAETRRAAFPPAEDGEVAFVNGGAPCYGAYVDDDTVLNPQGDCSFHAAGDLKVTAVTPFGRFLFGICNLDYDVVVGGERGETWTTVKFESGEEGEGWRYSGCGDIDMCESERDSGAVAWRGRLTRDGDRLVHAVEACLQTCLGIFRGTLTATLVRRAGALRSWELAGGLGDDGLRLDGAVEIDPTSIDVGEP